MATYRMTSHGTATGDSGYFYRWRKGQYVTEYTEGDLSHVSGKEAVGFTSQGRIGTYETRPMRPAPASQDSSAPAPLPAGADAADSVVAYSLGGHTGAGWYKVLKGGEPVIGDDGEPKTVGRGKDKAQKQIDQLNEERH